MHIVLVVRLVAYEVQKKNLQFSLSKRNLHMNKYIYVFEMAGYGVLVILDLYELHS